jgi:glycine/D-amino acid oxidase-like deaminating enzyme
MDASFWERDSFYAGRDVVIAGAGLAGLWSAYELYKNDNTLKILVLEKGVIPAGASTRNAGFACFGSPTELLHDRTILGEEKMWEVVEMRYRGIEKIRKHFKRDLIDFDDCGGYELLNENYKELPLLDEQLQWLNAGLQKITGMEETYIREDKKLEAFKFSGFLSLIKCKPEGGLHSGKLVQALTKKLCSLGIEIMTGVEVTSWQQSSAGIKIFTGQGIEFIAGKLLFCTNAFSGGLTGDVKVTPARGQVLLTGPVEGLPFTGTFHFDEGFYYFRNLGNRVLLGGARNRAIEEETTTVFETTPIIQEELERFLQQHILPGRAYAIEQRWSGIMGFTGTKLPEAKQIHPNVYALVTCNGMGVALAPIMAERAVALVLQE